MNRDDEVREMYYGEGQHRLLETMITAAQLDGMTFPELTEHVPHVIPEGFGILAGSPKAGKSWMTAGIALACAQGGFALGGISVEKRSVLLLALEDGHRRLQSRMRHLNGVEPLPSRLDILTDIPPGFAKTVIELWLDRHRDDENPPLVILDTLGRARPQRRAGDDPYIADYQIGSKLKEAVDAVPGSALVAVHHTRKMAAEDFLDTLSGTQGIAGSADYVIVLNRKRKSDEGVLSVTGRDIAENEYALKVDNGVWVLDGMDILDAAATVTARADRAEENKLGSTSLDALKFVLSRAQTSPKELAEHLKVDNKRAGTILGRLADTGHIARTGRGTYSKNGEESEESEETACSGTLPLPALSSLSPVSSPT
jgi:RecA-family ATPase